MPPHWTGQDRTGDVDGRDPAGRPGRSTGPHPDGREEWDPRLSRLSLFPVAAPHRRTFSPPPWSRQQSHVLHSPLLVVRTSHWSRTDDARPALLRDDGMPAHRLRPASFSVIVKGRDCWGKSGWTARRNGRGCHPDMPHNLVGPPGTDMCVPAYSPVPFPAVRYPSLRPPGLTATEHVRIKTESHGGRCRHATVVQVGLRPDTSQEGTSTGPTL